MTWVTPATSMPRAATSVATRTWSLSSRNLVSAFSRATWAMSPCSGAGPEAALVEVVGDPLGLPLGAGEDDHLAGVLGLQDAADHLGLVEVVGQVDELRGRGHHRGLVGRLGADVHRVAHVGAGQRDDRRRHGGREQHRLPGLGGHARAAARRRAGSRGRASRRPRRARARARARGRGRGGWPGRSAGRGCRRRCRRRSRARRAGCRSRRRRRR